MNIGHIARWLSVTLMIVGCHAVAAGCGADGPACAVALGEYRVAEPPDGPVARPVLVFLHGYGGSAQDILARRQMIEEFTGHGYVVIAPQALVRPDTGRTAWHLRPGTPSERDELAFIRQIKADATGRFHLDSARALLAGESLGGSLTWYLACRAPGDFAAYAPVDGGFWSPLPTGCAGPVKLLHTHGWTDTTVPLEGRIIGHGRVQGDIFAGLAIWRAANGCASQAPSETSTDGMAWHRRWTGCAAGTWLEFVLHDGGHEVPSWWAPMTRAWFERFFLR